MVVDGKLIDGINGVAGEWGHMPLPWPSAEERGAHKMLVRAHRLPGDLGLRLRLRRRLSASTRAKSWTAPPS